MAPLDTVGFALANFLHRSQYILSVGGRVRLLTLASTVSAVMIAATPAAGAAQSLTSAASSPALSIPDNVTRARARQNLDRAAAYVAMARQAPAAAPDVSIAHRAAQLARESAAAYNIAIAEFVAGSYHKVMLGSHRSIEAAHQAIASVLPAAPVVEAVATGEVSLEQTGEGEPPAASPPPRTRYHGASPDAPPRPDNWRVLGPVPFGAAAVEPAASLQTTTHPFGLVSPSTTVPLGVSPG